MREIYCSSGAIVGRINGNDYTLIGKHLLPLVNTGLIDGVELMFASSFYDKLSMIGAYLNSISVNARVIHLDKEIGIMLSECDDASTALALDMLERNLCLANETGIKRAVFHLWGGLKSDTRIDYNIAQLDKILNIADKHRVKIMIENIPCVKESALSVWDRIARLNPEQAFIFDTRFGAFHDEIYEILESEHAKRIEHIHISDYSSYPRNFERIRPILHPGEGVIDFKRLFRYLDQIGYEGTFTLESPVMHEDFTDTEKLVSTLTYLKNNLKH